MTQSKNILVTGGAGFIGSHTVLELLDAGHNVVIVDEFRNSQPWIIDRLIELAGRPLAFYEGDCAERELLNTVFRDHEIDGVIHFAAYKAVGESIRVPWEYFANNINSLAVLIEAMSHSSCRDLVFSSSCTVYGEPEGGVVKESMPDDQAISPYGFTKVAGEKLIQYSASQIPDFRAVNLRYFNPIGALPSGKLGELPLGPPNNLVPYVTQTAAGKRDSLTIFGEDYPTPDGTCVRDYIHVMDVAKAHVLALHWLLEQPKGTIDSFNLGTGKPYSVKEVVDTFEKVNGVKVNHEYGPKRPGDVAKVYADPTKAKHVLGWEAEYSLEDALKHAWTWEQSLS